MQINIRDPETATLVRELASRRGVGLTEAVRSAVKGELARLNREPPFLERIEEIQRKVMSYPDTGRKADKAFFDELSGEP